MATIDRLKKKEARMILQLAEVRREIAVLEGRPAQRDLPAVPTAPPRPPRALSEAERVFRLFREAREEEFELHGIPFVPDRPSTPAFVNTAMQPVIAAANALLVECQSCGSAKVREAVKSVDDVLRLFFFHKFFTDKWAAGLEPPWPFNAFVSDRVWPKYIPSYEASGASP